MSNYQQQPMNHIVIDKHFVLNELQCKCCKTVKLNDIAFKSLIAFRKLINIPLLITSGYRCSSHNAAVGGAKFSLHLYGAAFDIIVQSPEINKIIELAKQAGFRGILKYRNEIRWHFDIRMGAVYVNDDYVRPQQLIKGV